jgi:sugar-phosphate isomerases, RpiB/LacA/LacB family
MDKLQRTIFLAGDHAGLELKEILKTYLTGKNYKVEDLGPYSGESCDYPDFASKLCTQVQNSNNLGILVCSTGTGISIAANKFKNIRCAICNNLYIAKASIEKDNPNVIAIGGKVVGPDVAKVIVDDFLNSKLSGKNEEPADKQKLQEIENANLLN